MNVPGYLSYGEYMPTEHNVGDDVTLKVEIINEDGSEYIQSIGWFYNSTPICVCSCSSHYILSNDSKNLIIVNASNADVGTYEAKVTSYVINSYNQNTCDKETNKLLRNHAAFAPVTYTMNYQGKTQFHCLIMYF